MMANALFFLSACLACNVSVDNYKRTAERRGIYQLNMWNVSCTEDTYIKDAEDCEAASKEFHLRWTPFSMRYVSNAPRGCWVYQFEWNANIARSVGFNTMGDLKIHEDNTGKTHWRQICKLKKVAKEQSVVNRLLIGIPVAVFGLGLFCIIPAIVIRRECKRRSRMRMEEEQKRETSARIRDAGNIKIRTCDVFSIT